MNDGSCINEWPPSMIKCSRSLSELFQYCENNGLLSSFRFILESVQNLRTVDFTIALLPELYLYCEHLSS